MLTYTYTEITRLGDFGGGGGGGGGPGGVKISSWRK